MANPKQIEIKESLKEIKQLFKTSIPLIAHRIRVLLILKQNEAQGISKRETARLAGVSADSVQRWRTIYLNEGIVGLLKHKMTGYKPSVFTAEEHDKLSVKLTDPTNELRGYVELNEWVKKEFGKEILYRTLVNYCTTNFNSSVKTARKSHIKKDVDKVDSFKKTSIKSAKKSGTAKNTNFNP